MPVDSSIISGGYRPTVALKDPLQIEQERYSLASMRDEGRMRQMKIDEAQRGQQEQVRLSDLMRQSTDPTTGKLDRNKFASGAAQGGLGHRLGAIQKQWGELDKDEAETSYKRAQTQKHTFETQKGKLDAVNAGLSSLAGLPQPTHNDAIGVVTNMVHSGVISPEEGQQMVKNLPPNPNELKPFFIQRAMQGMEASKRLDAMLPQFKQVNDGKTMRTVDLNPVTNPRGPAPITMQTTPDADMTDRRVKSEGAANRGVTMRGQNMTDARAKDANNVASNGNVIKTETDLRKEFADLPEVKRYKAALPSWKAIESASKSNNPQADINLIYGLAKLYDPESVVREGEYATIANSQAIPQWLLGQAQRLSGGGRLTPETKKQVLEQARGRIATYEGEFNGAKGSYGDIATKRGANPSNVFPAVSPSMSQTGNRPPLDSFGGGVRPPLSSFGGS